MDAHTLELLEFEKVCELVASYASSSLGKRLARSMRPATDPEIVQRELLRTSEMCEALESALDPPLGGLRDVDPLVRKAELGMLLEAEQLLELSGVLEASGRVQDFAMRLGPDYPLLDEMLESVRDFRPLARTIEARIDSRARVRDDASPELAKVRRELAQFEERIQAELRRILRNPEIRRALRYTEATVSGESHVLPVAVNYRHLVPGVVHRTSSSGETLYVEPAKVAEINADSAVVRGAEQREIRRVLRGMTELVRRDAVGIRGTLEVLALLDFVVARARYSRDFAMSAPEVGENRPVRLDEARHPLLANLVRLRRRALAEQERLEESERQPGEPDAAEGPSEVVPINVRLGGAFDLMIITGPNTGGKTVALKTVGLLALMAQCGLHIPARPGSRLPILEKVLADIGDEQSLEQNLSTFSSHVSRIGVILKESGPRTLVLLDELGAGTEPSEGAALGRALLDELLARKCLAMVTTHLNDLKTFALSAPRAENAAMQFDAQTLRPTYELVIERFGESCALKIAERLGLPDRVLTRAYSNLERGGGLADEEMVRLQELRHEAEKAREEARRSKDEADRAAEEYRRKAGELRQEAEVRDEIERARAGLRAGDAVRLTKLGKTGSVIRVDTRRRKAAVAVGALEWEVALDDLLPLSVLSPS